MSRRGDTSGLLSRSRAVNTKPYKAHQFHGISNFKKYQFINQMGKGTFGIVYKGRQLSSGHLVAIKQILMLLQDDGFPVTARREITVMKQMKHTNIVDLIEIISGRPDECSLYEPLPPEYKTDRTSFIVLPYMPFDLAGILKNPKIILKETDIKSCMYQLLNGMNYMHQNLYLHRDIKTANILVNHTGVLKIADFGLARPYEGKPPTDTRPGYGISKMTAKIQTRWYRAPEMVLLNSLYTTAIDIWSIGCVFGELYEKAEILRGRTDPEQFFLITQLVGEDTSSELPNINNFLRENPPPPFGIGEPQLERRFSKHMSAKGLDLFKKLLTLNPKNRITASAAMKHEWFQAEPKLSPSMDVKFGECHEADFPRSSSQKLRNPKDHSHTASPAQARKANFTNSVNQYQQSDQIQINSIQPAIASQQVPQESFTFISAQTDNNPAYNNNQSYHPQNNQHRSYQQQQKYSPRVSNGYQNSNGPPNSTIAQPSTYPLPKLEAITQSRPRNDFIKKPYPSPLSANSNYDPSNEVSQGSEAQDDKNHRYSDNTAYGQYVDRNNRQNKQGSQVQGTNGRDDQKYQRKVQYYQNNNGGNNQYQYQQHNNNNRNHDGYRQGHDYHYNKTRNDYNGNYPESGTQYNNPRRPYHTNNRQSFPHKQRDKAYSESIYDEDGQSNADQEPSSKRPKFD